MKRNKIYYVAMDSRGAYYCLGPITSNTMGRHTIESTRRLAEAHCWNNIEQMKYELGARYEFYQPMKVSEAIERKVEHASWPAGEQMA
jgi:hypothetical protein